MKLLKTALCALALTAGIGATAQVKQTDETRIGEWLIIEEYEIKDNDATVSRQTKVQVGDKSSPPLVAVCVPTTPPTIWDSAA